MLKFKKLETDVIILFPNGVAGEKPDEPEYILVSFQPLLDETSLGAKSHIDLFKEVTAAYALNLEDCICLIGDNCPTNQDIANKMKIPLIGCASHRFNLAVEQSLHEHEEILAKLDHLMSKLKTLKGAARLRQKTQLRAVKRNVTRWNSTRAMLQR